MSTLSQFFGGASGGIRSVQRGVFAGSTTPTTITISSINPAKSFVNITSSWADEYYIRIASATTLEALSYFNSGHGVPVNYPLHWEVIEFN